ncbi:MAG: nucleoid-associated protein [Bacteroidia bacterium]
MIDYTNTILSSLSVHYTGNVTNGEDLILSNEPINIEDAGVDALLVRFFTGPFAAPIFYSFKSESGNPIDNVVCNSVQQIFKNPKSLHKHSVTLAKHVYEKAIHPQIKGGHFIVAFLENVFAGEEEVDAIAIFKVENLQSFITIGNTGEAFNVSMLEGINTEKLDKACLVFNTNEENGYKVCFVDRSNPSADAKYWTELFLSIEPLKDEYHHTKIAMDTAKTYVTKQLKEEFEVNKADQIDFLNRSAEYFKTNETFDKKQFEKEVFQDERIIKSFRDYSDRSGNNYSIEDFDGEVISPQAVQQQSKIFKSVLKLDKNFHIYIHGDRSNIERGVEKDGRKYYKIYFDKEA